MILISLFYNNKTFTYAIESQLIFQICFNCNYMSLLEKKEKERKNKKKEQQPPYKSQITGCNKVIEYMIPSG